MATEIPKRHWWRAAIVCVACALAFASMPLVDNARHERAILAAVLIALIAGYATIVLTVLGRANWRFSLRTLLIAITAVAVAIGLIVALRTYKLFDWTGVTPTNAFNVASPYTWDLSNLYTTGKVTLAAIPEPSSLMIAAALGVVGLLVQHRRSRS